MSVSKNDKRVIWIYGDIAQTYFVMDEILKSEKYYIKALDAAELLLGSEHDTTLLQYDNIATFYHNVGNYAKEITYIKNVLAMREKVLEKDDIMLAKSYSHIASFYISVNEYTKALSYFKKSLPIREKSVGQYNIHYLGENNNLALTYYLMGDTEKALKSYKRTLDLDTSHKLITEETYNKIALIYMDLEDYNTALMYYEKALNLRQNRNSVMLSGSYLDIGKLYKEAGDYNSSLSYFKQAMQIDENIYGKNVNKTGFYSNVAQVYQLMGEHDKALDYYKKTLLDWESKYGKDHVFVMEEHFVIAKLYKIMKNYPEAYKSIQKSFNLFLKSRDEMFSVLDNKQKNNFIKLNSKRVDTFLSTTYLYIKSDKRLKKPIAKNIFNSWLNYKGSIFDSENAIGMLYSNTKDLIIKNKIETLVLTKRKLAKLYQSLPKSKERKNWIKNIEQKEEKISKLTSEISVSTSSFTEQQGLKSIHYKDIAKNLKDNELYIDYAKAGDYYYVFSLDSKENITFTQIDANNTKKIDTLVKTFREDVNSILNDTNLTDNKLDKLTMTSKDKLSELYTLVLPGRLSKQLKNKKSLILSPDGALRLLPFESLFNQLNNKYLIEQKEIRYIPSGKELVRLYKYTNANVMKENNSTVVFSNPNFNAKDIAKVASHNKEIAITLNTNRTGIIKSLFRMRFAPLPGTKAEAESIKHTLGGKNLTEYTEDDASEANLMKVKEPKILHIATHGFFINDNTIPNPMLKSGIALSGANKSVIKGKSDGVVTALKLSGLELKGTDLVVLSACQTGVVDINSTDSVSGLSKAFIQAGAKDIVMSLWSVDDEATKDLMSSFYQEMQTHPSYAKALKEAKLKMIEKGMHPFYWAPFIVNGL